MIGIEYCDGSTHNNDVNDMQGIEYGDDNKMKDIDYSDIGIEYGDVGSVPDWFQPEPEPQSDTAPDPLAFDKFMKREQEYKDNESVINKIADMDTFKKYQFKLQADGEPILKIADNIWVIPAYDKAKNEMKPSKYYHVTRLVDGYTCDCREDNFLLRSCHHINVIEMIEEYGNPTDLVELDVRDRVRTHLDSKLICIDASERTKSTTVWSVNCPMDGGLAFVTINEAQKCITCLVCRSSHKHCSHMDALNEHLFESTGGFNVYKNFKAQKEVIRVIYDPINGLMGDAVDKPK